jgi:hypothetical protein
LRFAFLEADKATLNKRFYPKAVLSKAIREVQSQIAKGAVFGSSTHRNRLELDDVSHLIQKLELEGNLAVCEAKILPTSRGRNLQVILKHGRLGVSARGAGSVKQEGDQEVVQDDYEIKGVDFCTSPASGMLAGKENILESVGAAVMYPSAGILDEEQILDRKFYYAQKADYKGSWEQFCLIERNKDLLDLFDFACRCDYKGSFADFVKSRRT